MTATKHDMYLLVRKAICPVCSGLIKSLVEGQIYKLYDCTSQFKVIDLGLTDRYIEVEKIGGGRCG